ncbi:mitochondrial ATPase inhibitor, IATP domain-containing protein [Phthorimaea operculella]|nr:mitochondrial ATPase inhibitor, IATP domain-containing protein [Phthorimaea operculella]
MSSAAGRKIIHLRTVNVRMLVDESGRGAGKSDGHIGGCYGKKESAREDEYFYKKNKEQLGQLKNHLSKEISYHKAQIHRHKEAIRRHNQALKDKSSECKD